MKRQVYVAEVELLSQWFRRSFSIFYFWNSGLGGICGTLQAQGWNIPYSRLSLNIDVDHSIWFPQGLPHSYNYNLRIPKSKSHLHIYFTRIEDQRSSSSMSKSRSRSGYNGGLWRVVEEHVLGRPEPLYNSIVSYQNPSCFCHTERSRIARRLGCWAGVASDTLRPKVLVLLSTGLLFLYPDYICT